MIDKMPLWFRGISFALILINAISFVLLLVFAILSITCIYASGIFQLVLFLVVVGFDLVYLGCLLITLLINSKIK